MDIGQTEQHQSWSNLPKEDAAEAACRFKWPGGRGGAGVTLPGSVFRKISVQAVRSFPLNPSKEFKTHHFLPSPQLQDTFSGAQDRLHCS